MRWKTSLIALLMLCSGCAPCVTDQQISNLFPPEEMLQEWEAYPPGSSRGEFVEKYTMREEAIYQLNNHLLLGVP